jgi:ribosomal protein S12 methylthiotransferase
LSRTFHLIGLGCPKNQVDSEVIWAGLAEAGWMAVDEPAAAELIVVNSCAFIQAAVEESLETILALDALRRSGRLRWLVVAGCLPARYGSGLLDELVEVDCFCCPGEAGRLAAHIEALRAGGPRWCGRAGESFLLDAATPRVNALSTGAAYLKVADGCSRRCSFCIIPQLRGPQCSRPLDDLLAEAENLVRWGVSEIVLVAQDLAAWGRDLPQRPALAELVDALAGVAGLDWLRLMYLFPAEVSPRLLRVMAERDNVLAYLDVPLQHVDPEVLRRMHRGGGDPEAMLDWIAGVRRRLPGAVLRSTLMTGFPGESAAAFARLEDFVARAAFERLGVFAYSAEEGTAAAELDGAVAPELAAERRDRLLAVQQPIAAAYHRGLIGRPVEVLVEGAATDGRLVGRAWNQAPEVDGETRIHGRAILGEVVAARVTGADAYDLEAEVVESG